MSYPENCPECGADFKGDPIPEESRQHYGTSTHFSRVIGIDGDYIGLYDGIVAWQCPDCGHEFPRSQHPLFLDMFKKYKEIVNEQQNKEDVNE